jgi:predicted metal-dependent hydrolase
MMNYTLTRSQRKTVGIYIRDGAVEVRAPLKLAQADIDRFVASKAGWITGKLSESAIQAQQRNSFELHYGDRILYRGIAYPITAKPGNRVGFDGMNFWMPPHLSSEHIKTACIQIYRLCAKQVLSEKVMIYAAKMGVRASAVKINGAKTRWGSCSARGSLNFSWRLLMAEDTVVDYVVVHELAHIFAMNHSATFWAIVERILPDYQVRQERLKTLGKRLSVENWASAPNYPPDNAAR